MYSIRQAGHIDGRGVQRASEPRHDREFRAGNNEKVTAGHQVAWGDAEEVSRGGLRATEKRTLQMSGLHLQLP